MVTIQGQILKTDQRPLKPEEFYTHLTSQIFHHPLHVLFTDGEELKVISEKLVKGQYVV